MQGLFDTDGFPPRWLCGDWSAAHGWTHVLADLGIFGAYVSIPAALLVLRSKRPELPFSRITLLFVLFILSCGIGHLVEAGIFWWPAYRLSALVKVTTAVVSWATVIVLWRNASAILRLPDLTRAVARLEAEVAERQRVEDSLRQSEERYRTFVDASSSVVWVCSPDGRFREPQESWQAYTGQAWEQHRGGGWLAMIHPRDRRRVARAWLRGRRECRPCAFEGRLWSQEHGAYRSFRCRAIPILAPSGEVREWLGAMREIEDERQAEQRFEAVVEGAPNAMVLVGVDGRIALANTRAEELFSYEKGELVGREVECLVPEPFRAAHPGMRGEYFAAGPRPLRMSGRELWAVRKDGSELPVEIYLNPILFGGERFALSAIMDVSERRRDEEALRSYAAELEELNAALEETKEALEKGMDELERSNRALDDFAHVASHDLREPLRGIHNYATFLAEDYGALLDEEGRRRLSTLPRLASRMDTLIESLLVFSRVGRLDLAVGPTDLGAVLVGALEAIAPMIEERGVDVRVPRPLPVVSCDAVRIGEVFHNLLTNAIKYGAERDPWVEVTWEPCEGGVVVHVRDNGIGIDPKHHESIFQIFRRLHGRDDYGGGAGAGLTIAKEIVARHGGTLRVDSRPGEGSTFSFAILQGEER